ncbi:ParB/Srx family N-terminal domain-containing protein [Celerinatantimonas sp. MCCC 1A17872]|uniref:ParB/Srx family N-terminal domain-containing protein n=1 Tax=Celerinatantimonas sp. MCCC 1A17872 TaxID=3177514 RepID=UPI0038CA012B
MRNIIRCGIAFISIITALSAYADTAIANAIVGKSLWTTIARVHPTQPEVGTREVAYKVNRFKLDAHKRFDEYCEKMGAQGVLSYSAKSKLAKRNSFSCKAAYGSDASALETVVIAPNHHIYLTDGHHTLTSFDTITGSELPVLVSVTHDFRALKNMDEFWQKMQTLHLVWLHSSSQGDIQPAQLPQHLGLKFMKDDPYRGVLYFVRDIGYQKPRNPPAFLEFYWEQWLKKNIDLSKYDLNSRSDYAALVSDVAHKMVNLAPNAIVAKAGTKEFRASELGALRHFNQHQMAKLVSPQGKLAYAFAN